MINYRIIDKQGAEVAGVIGKGIAALSTALHYYQQYIEEGEMQLKADKKILINYNEIENAQTY